MQITINRHIRIWAWLFGLLGMFVIRGNAQFSSGSTGADGALDYSNLPANSTVVFDPAKFNASLHPPGLYVYNFTNINIPASITVVLSGQLIKGPVFWLSQGDVLINGNIQASGQPGAPQTADTSVRVPAIPGPGGFFGGVGGNQSSAAQPGDGPLGGAAATPSSAGGGNGGFSGNLLLAPPIGGSGGGGAFCASPIAFGEGGGAGGGTLVIASSTTITLNGRIFITGGFTGGGSGCNGGGEGAGGAIKLAANTITGSGGIQAFGGDNLGISGNNGAIRLEAFQILDHNLSFSPAVTEAAPGALFVPTQPVSIQVVSVNGINLPAEPSGSFASPDVVINSGSSVTVAIQTSGIPPGTVLTLNIYSEDGTTQTVQTTALQGTLQLGTATASVTFPPDLSLGYLKATWTTTQ